MTAYSCERCGWCAAEPPQACTSPACELRTPLETSVDLLWPMLDTAQMAAALERPEHEVANALAHVRDRQYAARAA